MKKKVSKSTNEQLCWAVTGTFHGSLIWAKTEGEARAMFHEYYGGESITHVRIIREAAKAVVSLE